MAAQTNGIARNYTYSYVSSGNQTTGSARAGLEGGIGGVGMILKDDWVAF